MPLDPNISLGVKPVDFLGSAGNYLNLARGAQAFQQEQAMNPIQQEKARIELKTLQDTQAAEIARLKAISGQNVVAEEQARFNQAGSVQERLQQVFAPLFKLDSFQDVTKDPRAAFRDVMAAKQQAIAAGVPPESAEMFSASLYSRIEDALNRKDQTPVNEWAFRNLFSRQTAAAQQQAFAPIGAPPISAAGVPGYPVAEPGRTRFQPLEIGQRPAAPAMPQEGVETGAVPLSMGIKNIPFNLGPYETGPTDKRGAGVPKGQPELIPSQQPVAQPQGVTAPAMSMPGLRYPVRQQGTAFLPAQGEEADREIGMKYVNGLVSLQPQMQTTRRNIQEVVSKANEIEKNAIRSTGVLGAAERKIREFVGDTNYQQLSKDLANLQISLIQAKGGSLDTVAGQGLAQHANGDKTYAPEVLRAIARRTYGDVLATEAEGAAADLFRQRYGDANHAAFKQLWSKNSDSRVFELMGLEDLVQDPKEQEKVTKEIILKGLSPKQIDELTKKYRNIKRLRETGSL
jgi:hypothetical protein